MDPFQSQIIAKNPIGKRLDSFQEAFRLTCAKLSISASADAVQQVVKNGEKHRVGSEALTDKSQAVKTCYLI